MTISQILTHIRHQTKLSSADIAKLIGTSLVAITKWENGIITPSPQQQQKIETLYTQIQHGQIQIQENLFASSGVYPKMRSLLSENPQIQCSPTPHSPIWGRVTTPDVHLNDFFINHHTPARTAIQPPIGGMSAGKNTYTYDAHTYHTKIPPQAIVELLKHYLPDGGLVLDSFSGSGMTGVATQLLGYDCILNDISPSACFIANRFNSWIDPDLFEAGFLALMNQLKNLRHKLYITQHREMQIPTEIEYTIWSYWAVCDHCQHEFCVWDSAKEYGNSVREHKIRSQFPCPSCGVVLKKSSLKRTTAKPVMVAYRDGQVIRTHPLNPSDDAIINDAMLSQALADGYYPQTSLYQGVNLRQPMAHGINRVDEFYTPRNLVALSHLWKAIHQLDDDNLAGFMAFVFTSLYQRVTKFAEYRFWGGSGNMPRFNVPFVFKEANVFTTFERKAREIFAHLTATASHYRGRTVILNGSATHLENVPDESIDFIFIDPPFGGNIHYSEMNILWESWLGKFTNPKDEIIINKYQQKDITFYQQWMTDALSECHRVLRPSHWMLVAFMNASDEVWEALRQAILTTGFEIVQVDIFDKQHQTFKQFVDKNTVGMNLILHCKKVEMSSSVSIQLDRDVEQSVHQFLSNQHLEAYKITYLHVNRQDDFDMSRLYAEWLAYAVVHHIQTIDFKTFQRLTSRYLVGDIP